MTSFAILISFWNPSEFLVFIYIFKNTFTGNFR